MKIAVFHNLPPGGAKRTVYEQVKRLSVNNKVDVYEFKYRENDFLNLSLYASNVYKYNFEIKSNLPSFLKRLEKDYQNFILLPKVHENIAKDINLRGYDVVLAHSDIYTESPYILRYLKVPTAYFCHELLRIAYEKIYAFNEDVGPVKKIYEELTRKIRKYIDRNNARSSTLILTSSGFIKDKVGIAYGKTAVKCYPGVDQKYFKPDKKKINQILFMGNKLNSEGYDLATTAVRLIPKDIRPDLKILKFKKNKIDIENDHSLSNAYSESIATLCLDHEEPFGLKSIESMACGTPVIAVNEGGYRESVINGKTGYLIKRDPRVLAKKIIYLINNPKIANNIGKYCIEIVGKKWSWDKHVEAVEKALYSIMK
jgi:glycosyltransferase involved in cell wall biosynthesis